MRVLKCFVILLFLSVLYFTRNVEGSSQNGHQDATRKNVLNARSTSSDDEKKTLVSKKGDTIKLECEFPTQSWSFIQWVKLYLSDGFKSSIIPANQTYTNGSAEISLIILKDVSKEDAGNYSCISASASGATTFEFNVVVKETLYCEEHLCASHGECTELLNGYLCNCHPGYVGNHCELEDPCFQQPCLNNGSCTTIDDDFNCTCLEDFAGAKCERKICTPSSCSGGGSCSETDDGQIKCNCRYNRAGERCQHSCTFSSAHTRYPYNYCSYKTCMISTNGRERCECHTHSNVNHCLMESDLRNECSDANICNRQGSCRDYPYQYKCECNRYYSGKNCELRNECNTGNNMCQRYGGTCVDLPVGYKCINCPSGQHGDKCQFKPNPCKVTCYQTSMQATCDLRFLNEKISSVPIYLNSKSCTVDRNRQHHYRRYNRQYWQGSKNFAYNSCGTDFQYEDGYLVYRNTLRSGEPSAKGSESDIITRMKGYFRFDMECRIPLSRNTSSAGLSDLSLPTNETTELKDEGSVDISSSISFCKQNWQTVTNYVTGDRLYVKLYLTSLSNSAILTYGVLHPVTCFATADRFGRSPRYVLIQDGCIKDETLRYERGPLGRNKLQSFFSFDSFSFKDNPGKLYLHCDARICMNRTENRNDADSSHCETPCRKQKVIAVTKEIVSDITNSASTPAIHLVGREKRSLGFFESLFGTSSRSRHGQETIERGSRSIVRLLQGQAFF